MKVFDGKTAANEYMATHTLAFSTPELTLMRFAFWLGDTVPDPANKTKTMPRMQTFMIEQDFEPVLIDDDSYVPTGAVKNTSMYGTHTKSTDIKFCSQCGTKLSTDIKFCSQCGAQQQ